MTEWTNEFGVTLSVDKTGRKHRDKGAGGGQFTKDEGNVGTPPPKPPSKRDYTNETVEEGRAISRMYSEWSNYHLNQPKVLRHLNVPKVMYHLAPRDRVDSIQANGLVVGSPTTSQDNLSVIRGVYLTSNPRSDIGGDLSAGNMVVVEIDTEGLDLRLDPEFFYADSTEDAEGYVAEINKTPRRGGWAMYSQVNIPPSHVKVTKQTGATWKPPKGKWLAIEGGSTEEGRLMDWVNEFGVTLSVDKTGREHRGKGAGGGQFTKTSSANFPDILQRDGTWYHLSGKKGTDGATGNESREYTQWENGYPVSSIWVHSGEDEVTSNPAPAPKPKTNPKKRKLSGPTGVNAPTFAAWFGDSKVVDDNGNPKETHGTGKERRPIKVYHGTGSNFDAFDKSKARAGNAGTGFYFAENREIAEAFAEDPDEDQDDDEDYEPKPGRIIKAYLSIQNPFVIDDDFSVADATAILDHAKVPVPDSWSGAESVTGWDIWQTIRRIVSFKYPMEGDTQHYGTDGVNEILQTLGYDGLSHMSSDWHGSVAMPSNSIEAGGDGSSTEGGRCWVAFEPTQIKKTSNTTYDPTNPDMNLSLPDRYTILCECLLDCGGDVPAALAATERIIASLSTDASGREHRGKGEGGGQFTKTSGGDSTGLPNPTSENTPPARASKRGGGFFAQKAPPCARPVLTDDEKQGVKGYCWTSYRSLNNAIRKGQEPSERDTPADQAVWAALGKVEPFSRPIEVLRGIDLTAEEQDALVKGMEEAQVRGGTVEMKGWISTTMHDDLSKTEGFETSSVVLHIEATHGLDVTTISPLPDENELLLADGSHFTPVSTERKNGTLHVHLRQVVPPPPDLSKTRNQYLKSRGISVRQPAPQRGPKRMTDAERKAILARIKDLERMSPSPSSPRGQELAVLRERLKKESPEPIKKGLWAWLKSTVGLSNGDEADGDSQVSKFIDNSVDHWTWHFPDEEDDDTSSDDENTDLSLSDWDRSLIALSTVLEEWTPYLGVRGSNKGKQVGWKHTSGRIVYGTERPGGRAKAQAAPAPAAKAPALPGKHAAAGKPAAATRPPKPTKAAPPDKQQVLALVQAAMKDHTPDGVRAALDGLMGLKLPEMRAVLAAAGVKGKGRAKSDLAKLVENQVSGQPTSAPAPAPAEPTSVPTPKTPLTPVPQHPPAPTPPPPDPAFEAKKKAVEQAAAKATSAPVKPTGPRHLTGPQDSKTFSDWVTGANATRELGVGYKAGKSATDAFMEELNKETGYDAQPQLVDEAEMDAHIAQGGTELFRGVAAADHVSAFQTGNFFAGLGLMGNGTYTAKGVIPALPRLGVAEKSGYDVALDYSGSAGIGKGTDESRVMRMSLNKNARIVGGADREALMTRQWDEVRALRARAYSLRKTDSAAASAANRQADIFMDFGRYAQLHGYDAIDNEDAGYIVVLNRGACIVQRTPASGAKAPKPQPAGTK